MISILQYRRAKTNFIQVILNTIVVWEQTITLKKMTEEFLSNFWIFLSNL